MYTSGAEWCNWGEASPGPRPARCERLPCALCWPCPTTAAAGRYGYGLLTTEAVRTTYTEAALPRRHYRGGTTEAVLPRRHYGGGTTEAVLPR